VADKHGSERVRTRDYRVGRKSTVRQLLGQLLGGCAVRVDDERW
jgi:hypothetical protein